MTTRTEEALLGTSSTHAAFAELICQDDELLQIEFEALVAAEWSWPPPRGLSVVAMLVEPPARAPTVRPGAVLAGYVDSPPYVGPRRSRQRAPPDRLAT